MKGQHFTLFGYPLEVRPSALIIFALVVLMYGGGGREGLAMAIMLGVVFIISIMVHELGHAIVANRFGLGPVSIVLHGFGGLTIYRTTPSHGQGLIVSLAGPFAGFALAALGEFVLAPVLLGPGSHFLLLFSVAALVQINLFWSAFNLLPIYPLDGGQVLWHALAMRMPAPVARRRTGTVSAGIAAVVGIYALINDPIFIAVICLLAFSQNNQLRR